MELHETRLFRNTRIDLSKITVNEFPNNFTIALEGDKSNFIGVVLEGTILIKTYSYGGKNFTLKVIEEDGILGDVLLFGNTPSIYPGSIITKGITKMATIPNKEFKKYLLYDNDLLNNFISGLCEKTYEMNVKSKLYSQDTVRDKILFWIHTQMRASKERRIELNMTKEELANILFIQRPSLSRELINMKKDGIIEYDRTSITLLK